MVVRVCPETAPKRRKNERKEEEEEEKEEEEAESWWKEEIERGGKTKNTSVAVWKSQP